MTATMTSRERVFRLLRRELPDRMGLFEHFWGETIPRWQGEGFPDGVSPEEFFGFDLIFAGWSIHFEPTPCYAEVIEETEECVLTRNGYGALLRTWKHKSGTPEHVGFDCTTPERWEEKYKPLLTVFNPERVQVENVRGGMERAQRLGKFSVSCGLSVFEIMRASLGDVVMMESMALEPEWIDDICRTYTDCQIRHLKALYEEVGHPDGALVYEDLGYNKGLFICPSMYREMLMPYHKELVDFFHSYDMPVIFHSCGNITAAVPSLVEVGIDCLQAMEVKAGVDVISLAEQFGDRLSFMGNLDVRVLEAGDKAAIEQEIVTKMEALKSLGAAFFFHSDHSITPNVSYASYQYALELFHKHGRY